MRLIDRQGGNLGSRADVFTVRVGNEERTVGREELEQYAEWVGLARVARGRYSWQLVLDLLIFDQVMGVDPSIVVEEIETLETGRPGRGTKPAAMFERAPLRGLWHKHFFSAHFVSKNILLQLAHTGWETVFESTLGGSQDSGTITRESLVEFVRKATVEQLERREEAEKLTGEWIVFSKLEGQNYYLCLATHTTGDEVIFERIKECCVQQFPFLVAQLPNEAI
jgi:hypothetical protein